MEQHPNRLVMRPATPADYPHFVRFFAELGVDEPVLSQEAWCAQWLPDSRLFEAAEGNCGRGPVGYAYWQVLADAGYIRHIVVDPSLRQKGLGTAIMKFIAAELRALRIRSWCLNVKPQNIAAVTLYERLGMKKAYDTTVLRITRDKLKVLVAQPGPSATEIDPGDDDVFEDAFKIPRGTFVASRRQGLLALGFVDPTSGARAVARFAPRLPGSFPFKVSKPSDAPILLRAIAPHLTGEQPWLQVVLEDDVPTTEFLLGAGATRHMEIMHMQGSIISP